MKNWKTTLGGVAAVLGALTEIAHAFATGTAPNWEADFTAISAGVGLVFAKDENVTGGSVPQ